MSGTADDLSEANINLGEGCYAVHGNLFEGIELPDGARILLTAEFGGGFEAPVMAEYDLGLGRVTLTTITMEFVGQVPVGPGATHLLTNVLGEALGGTGELDGGDPTGGRRRR